MIMLAKVRNISIWNVPFRSTVSMKPETGTEVFPYMPNPLSEHIDKYWHL
jgi:hypothetical protein